MRPLRSSPEDQTKHERQGFRLDKGKGLYLSINQAIGLLECHIREREYIELIPDHFKHRSRVIILKFYLCDLVF